MIQGKKARKDAGKERTTVIISEREGRSDSVQKKQIRDTFHCVDVSRL